MGQVLDAVRRRGSAVFIAIVWLVGSGCSSSNWYTASRDFLGPYTNGDHDAASAAAARYVKSCVKHDKVILSLEYGAILRAAGRLEESNAAFDDADRLVGDYEQWPDVRISEEAVASLTTVRNINYRGHLSDLVMLNAYHALNDMEMGNLDRARVALTRAQFVQSDIARRYSDALSKAQEEQMKREWTERYDLQKALETPGPDGLTINQQLEQKHYKALSQMEPYASYVNPFCDYLQGVFFLSTGGDASDLERAASAFKRVDAMVPSNPYVEQDVAEAERIADGGARTPTTYVIFETGMAPERGQVQIPIPFFLFNDTAPTVVVYLPTIAPLHGHLFELAISTEAGEFTTAVVCDMDAVVMQEFRNELPWMITRMLIGAATKAGINYALVEAVEGHDESDRLLRDLLNIVSLLYQTAMNQADLRTWRTLPKQFQVARFPTPANRRLTLHLEADGGGPVPVMLSDAGPVNIVYVKSVRSGVRPVVRHFNLGVHGGINGGRAAPAPAGTPVTGGVEPHRKECVK